MDENVQRFVANPVEKGSRARPPEEEQHPLLFYSMWEGYKQTAAVQRVREFCLFTSPILTIKKSVDHLAAGDWNRFVHRQNNSGCPWHDLWGGVPGWAYLLLVSVS
ncbi:MAG: hypothetical protein HFF50_09305 [Lawsonibacter sp.]|nr:hypothetical protein [Lawsonibacter sp.]